MKTNQNGLDEMQTEKRNSIGHQTLMLMIYALFLDTVLYGVGLRWLAYPTNIMVIIMACMGVYLIRTIMANACLPPKAQGRKTVVSIIMTVVFSAVLAIVLLILFGGSPARHAAGDTEDHSALVLLIVSGAALLISLIAALIRKAADRHGNDD